MKNLKYVDPKLEYRGQALDLAVRFRLWLLQQTDKLFQQSLVESFLNILYATYSAH